MRPINNLFLTIPCTFMLLFSSCSSDKEEQQEMEAKKLYEQTCRLTKLYTDSILRANDTTSIEGLMARFGDRLTDLNFSLTADTDLKLTEGENDTIAMLLTRLRHTYDARLDSVSGRHALPSDSVADKK